MSSRKRILDSLRSVNPTPISLPEIHFGGTQENLLSLFKETAESSGIRIIDTDEEGLRHFLDSHKQDHRIQSSIETYRAEFPMLLKEEEPFQPANIPDLYLCRAHFGVAENAAMWLDDRVLPSRILAFLPEKIVILLNTSDLVADMHQAYEKIGSNDYQYGLFMAGPSKTADIEQTLVTGAQGAKELTVVLMKSDFE